MRVKLRKFMDENKDTAGWGIVGTVSAFLTSSDIIMQVATAIAVTAAGTLTSFLVREVLIYGKKTLLSWWENRKKIKTSN